MLFRSRESTNGRAYAAQDGHVRRVILSTINRHPSMFNSRGDTEQSYEVKTSDVSLVADKESHLFRNVGHCHIEKDWWRYLWDDLILVVIKDHLFHRVMEWFREAFKFTYINHGSAGSTIKVRDDLLSLNPHLEE